VASLTKVITAWAALKMVADGLIDLDEPVLSHLDWELPLNGHNHGKGVTLRALLSHTAGLPRAASPQFPDEASIPPLAELLGGTVFLWGWRRFRGASFAIPTPDMPS
jgi:CubicO group peptidase (beta-lactamase class C family)